MTSPQLSGILLASGASPVIPEAPGPANPETSVLWFKLAMACRWPLALVLSAWAIAAAAITILKQPIPIGLPLAKPLPVQVHGALKIEGIAQPVRVNSDSPLGVKGSVSVERPVAVKTETPLQVDGVVNVDAIKEPVAVSEIKQEIRVDVSNDEPLNVNGTVGVDQVAGQVNVQLRDAVKSLSPIPLP